MSAILKADSATVRVGGKALIDDVSFTVAPGETIALVGPNGAGKSTLLRALSGEISLSGGRVVLKGRDLRTYSPHALAGHRSTLSQSVTVGFPFSVAEIVAMGARDRRGPGTDALIEAALDEVDLCGFRDRIITTLSGGEQQRAHFARVLVQLGCGETVHGPGLLLLDEPTASLDLRHQLDLIAAIRRRTGNGTTVIAVVHDLNLAAMMAERVLVLSRGRIAAAGEPGRSIAEPVLREVFGIADSVGRLPTPATPYVLPFAARRI
jgi:iron complex transport system ATP-binding protein